MRNLLIAVLFLFVSSSLWASNDKPSVKNDKPYGFIENKGQVLNQDNDFNSDVLFLLPGTHGMNVQLKANGFSYDSYKPALNVNKLASKFVGNSVFIGNQDIEYDFHRIEIEFLGAKAQPEIIAMNPASDYINYYGGNIPEDGLTGIRHYGKIIYKDLYPGIDLEFIQNRETGVKYNFIVHKGADPSLVQWKYKGNSADLVNEEIILNIEPGILKETIPLSWLSESGEPINIQYKKVDSETFSFKIPTTWNGEEMVIDPTPVLDWGTYYGGSGNDNLNRIAYSSSDAIYVVGSTLSTSKIATSGAHQTTLGGQNDAFLVKFNSAGQRIWSTYYGGSEDDFGYGVACDASGNVYMCGATNSQAGIATAGAHQSSIGGISMDAFLVKFNSSGTRMWGTYYGGADHFGQGNANDYASDVIADNNGNVYIVGETNSEDGIATPNAYQTYLNQGSKDAFIAKFNSSGVRQWGTYYGSWGDEVATAIDFDNAGNIFFCGNTTSVSGLDVTGGHQTTYGGGNSDGFVAKFNSSGSRIWSTYYGGAGEDLLMDLSLNPSGEIYVIGYGNSSTMIATGGTHQSTKDSEVETYLIKFKNNGGRIWGTYYGGESNDYGTSVYATDDAAYISGFTTSDTKIATAGAYQESRAGNYDAYLVKMNASGIREWGTYYGGEALDIAYGVEVIDDGTIYLAGSTVSASGIATGNGHQPTNGGGMDGFFTKFVNCHDTEESIEVSSCGSYTSPSGQNWTETGLYQDIIPNVSGCDSIITIKLLIFPYTEEDITVEACDEYTSPSGEHTWTESGEYIDVTTNSHGCKHLIYINLTILNSSVNQMGVVTCDSYEAPNGEILTESGFYSYVIPNSVGCDSFIYLNLTIEAEPVIHLDITECEQYNSPWGTVYSESGVYVVDLPSTTGCDSTIILDLKLNHATYSTLDIVNCHEWYSPSGQVYTESGTYQDIIPNAAGCDSVITINLTLGEAVFEWEIFSCDYYVSPSGKYTYSQPGIYRDTIISAQYCDSIFIIDFKGGVINRALTITGNTLSSEEPDAVYQWIDCTNNEPIPGATERSYTPEEDGVYGVYIIKGDCEEMSVCYDMTIVSEEYVSESDIKIYPNPVNDVLSVEVPESMSCKIFNQLGQIVHTQELSNGSNRINLPDLPDGMYILKAYKENTVYSHKLIIHH